MISCHTLLNDIPLLLESVPGTDVIAAGLWFPFGSRDENTTQAGFSHFIEHMLFKGTEMLDAYSIACEIDRVGGSINAFTEREMVAVYFSVPKEYFFRVFEILCDICFASIFPEDEICNEQQVICNEISASLDSPEETAFDEFMTLFWNTNPIAKPIMGTIESIGTIKRDAIYSHYRTYFRPQQCTVSIAGDFSNEPMKERVTEIIGRFHETGVPEVSFNERVKPEMNVFSEYREGQFSQSQIYIGTQFEKPGSLKEYYAYLIFSSAFGESMSSRLFQEIREKKGLCYSISSFRNYFSDIGLWMIYANTLTESTEMLLEAIESEIKKLSSRMIAEKELEDAKMQIKGTLILSKQDVEVRMKRLARQFIAMKKVITYDACYDLIEEVRITDIMDTVSAVFDNGPLSLLAYGGRDLGTLKHRWFSMML